MKFQFDTILQIRHYLKEHFMKKTILLSLMVSSLLAEDGGVFMSVGYQIGEAAQMVKNAAN